MTAPVPTFGPTSAGPPRPGMFVMVTPSPTGGRSWERTAPTTGASSSNEPGSKAADTGERVVLLDFAPRSTPLPAARLVGSVLDATLAHYPGSGPRRVLFATEPTIAATDAGLPAGVDLAAAHDVLSDALAQNPWTSRVPVVLAGAELATTTVRDATGAAVPLIPTGDPWRLAALTGGRPTTVFGELEDAGFRPLTIDLDAAGETQ